MFLKASKEFWKKLFPVRVSIFHEVICLALDLTTGSPLQFFFSSYCCFELLLYCRATLWFYLQEISFKKLF